MFGDTPAALARYLPVLRPHLGSLTRAALAGVCAQVAATALIATAAWLLATAAQRPNIEALMLAIVAVRGLALARGGLRYLERLTGHDAALRLSSELRASVFGELVRAGRVGKPDDASTRDADLMGRLVADVEAVQDALLRVVLPALATVVVGAVAVALGWVIDPVVGLTLLGFLVVTGLVLPASAASAERRMTRRVTAAEAELGSRALDLMRGTDDLAASGARADYEERALRASTRLAREGRRAAVGAALLHAAATATAGVGVLAVLWVALGTPAASGSVLPAVAALAALASLDVAAGLVDTARTWTRCRPALLRVARSLPSLDTDVSVPAVTEGAPPTDTGVETGTLHVQACGVRFGPLWALRDVTAAFPPGASVAVIGASGSGKSTLLRLMSGDVPPVVGRVRVDDVPASARRLEGHCRGLVDGAHVFRGSVRANVLLARPSARRDEVEDAARRARFLGFVDSLPDGWETEVGEGGRSLSGGERRRLLLTRALLARPPLLVLDEPTTGLDPRLSDEIVAELLGRGDVVLATHRLAPLRHATQVLVMDAGTIVQRGTAAELAAVPGPFADLLGRETLVSDAG
ncbi:thiol reductant ABC exporter subunit CydC [Spiractinospora alimapuensis]|uniref:thiol reductant ABC exporter subunit CydC n=1 Tax=Spiractinospora alimapuensis TaxID=2820884 RepID=UPI001F163B94|nr:thiol reductant ABC exporter subunit CydC [Spiractinospora alimapuensis]QVQ53671.1 thiol reductant ABC exporter subunit CydC [Spiractinospora alimapuensis]